ncbi:MAG: M3 family metallopeptidase [Myxococcota bacterium]
MGVSAVDKTLHKTAGLTQIASGPHDIATPLGKMLSSVASPRMHSGSDAAPFSVQKLAPGCQTSSDNPLLQFFDGPLGTPPFDRIREEHFLAAYMQGISQARGDIDRIVKNPEAPSFKNTIEAIDQSARCLGRIEAIFEQINGAAQTPGTQKIAQAIEKPLTELRNSIAFNTKLFERVQAVYNLRGQLDLSPEQSRLLDVIYQSYVRDGANLSDADKTTLSAINTRMAAPAREFEENVTKAGNTMTLIVDDPRRLGGIPQDMLETAAKRANDRGHPGQWEFTADQATAESFLTLAEDRQLRQQMYTNYINRGIDGGETDNRQNIKILLEERQKKAKLLGYESYAHYVLAESSAKTPEKVGTLLLKLWKPTLKKAIGERERLQKYIDNEGGDFKLEAWDWRFYAEKVRQKDYNLDEKEMRPYFSLTRMRDAAFEVAGRLYGLTFERRTDVPGYHADVEVYEVKNADGSSRGMMYFDHLQRDNKNSGAWMSSFQKQKRVGGKFVYPLIHNTCNFPRPSAGEPALLNFEQTQTLFHEFGHALHGLLSDVTYETLSGTAVPRDFVEFPSQFMENWVEQPEFLREFARHFKTGAPMPEEMIESLGRARTFNQGFATMEYLAAAILDLRLHALKKLPPDFDPATFEKQLADELRLLPEIQPRYRTAYFKHIFNGGYTAWYNAYLYSDILARDAFVPFEKRGLYDKQTAQGFRKIISSGFTVPPKDLYFNYRGAEPSIDALLRHRGLDEA